MGFSAPVPPGEQEYVYRTPWLSATQRVTSMDREILRILNWLAEQEKMTADQLRAAIRIIHDLAEVGTDSVVIGNVLDVVLGLVSEQGDEQ